jgi:hypothetical protein
MKNKSPKKARSRAEILAEIAGLPPSVQGTISSYRNVRKNGTVVTYHNLQHTRKGKYHSFAIPVDKLADFNKRTYYRNEEDRGGHYPFDDRLGLVGRYTPAAASEMTRHAVSHPCDEYRANGWFVGSGVSESGCKAVIGQRFKQSGMTWSLKGAKALLPLRTLYKSNRLEEFFSCLVRNLRQVDCAA